VRPTHRTDRAVGLKTGEPRERNWEKGELPIFLTVRDNKRVVFKEKIVGGGRKMDLRPTGRGKKILVGQGQSIGINSEFSRHSSGFLKAENTREREGGVGYLKGRFV